MDYNMTTILFSLSITNTIYIIPKITLMDKIFVIISQFFQIAFTKC